MLLSWSPLRVYLLITGMSSLLFGMVFTLNLVYQAEVVGLNPLQLVLVGTLLEIVGFTFEIPTGVVADLVSRRLSVLIGYALIGVGFMIEGAIPAFAAVLASQVIWGIGSTFTSGALEAWIADEVGEEQLGETLMRGAQVGRFGAIAGIIISGVLGSIALALPIVIGGAGFIVLTALLVLVMKETGFTPTPRAESDNTWTNMRNTFTSGVRAARASRLLMTFLAISFVFGAHSEGFDRLWRAFMTESFTFPQIAGLSVPIWFSLLSITAMVLQTIGVEIVRRRVDTTQQPRIGRALVIIQACGVAGILVFALAGDFVVAVIALMIIEVVRGIAAPLESVWINRNIPSAVRATVLSTAAQLNALGQIGAGPGVGFIGVRFGLRAAIAATALILLPVVLLYRRATALAR